MVIFRSIRALALFGAFCLAGPAWSAGPTEAEALLRAGEVEAALDSVRTHIEASPSDLDAHELLIDILTGTGQVAEAVTFYGALARESEASANCWYLFGRAEPSPEGARKAYEKALSLDTKHARAWMGMGAVERATNSGQAAARAYRTAVELDPSLGEAWAGLVAVKMEARDVDAAWETLSDALEKLPMEPEFWLTAAVLRREEAERYLGDGIVHVPDDHRLHAALARLRFEKHEWVKARSSYDAALLIVPTDPSLRVERALVDEIEQGLITPDGAQRLLEVRSSTAGPSAQLAQVSGLVAKNPRSAWALMVRGNLHAGTGDLQQGERDLRGALSRIPNNPEVQSALGVMLLATGRVEEAQTLLASASKARPRDVTLAVAAAVAAAQAGDVEDGERRMRDAMSRFPYSNGPALGLARLRLALGDIDGAYRVLSDRLMVRPDQEVVMALASVAIEAGQPQEAAKILRAAADASGDPRLQQAADALESGFLGDPPTD